MPVEQAMATFTAILLNDELAWLLGTFGLLQTAI